MVEPLFSTWTPRKKNILGSHRRMISHPRKITISRWGSTLDWCPLLAAWWRFDDREKLVRSAPFFCIFLLAFSFWIDHFQHIQNEEPFFGKWWPKSWVVATNFEEHNNKVEENPEAMQLSTRRPFWEWISLSLARQSGIHQWFNKTSTKVCLVVSCWTFLAFCMAESWQLRLDEMHRQQLLPNVITCYLAPTTAENAEKVWGPLIMACCWKSSGQMFFWAQKQDFHPWFNYPLVKNHRYWT